MIDLDWNKELKQIKEMVYDHCSLIVSCLKIEKEGVAYKACNFRLNDCNIISRNAKITPKKIGQFVTLWRRNEEGITAPFNEHDEIDFYLVNVRKGERIGQFVLPKSVLIDKGILSSTLKDGKRGFRVYPNWDTPSNKQAERTQNWQRKYFIEIEEKMDLNKVKRLYHQE